MIEEKTKISKMRIIYFYSLHKFFKCHVPHVLKGKVAKRHLKKKSIKCESDWIRKKKKKIKSNLEMMNNIIAYW